MENQINKLHIAAFSTNPTFYIPYSLFNIYLEKTIHRNSLTSKDNNFKFMFSVAGTKYLANIHPITNLEKVEDICSFVDCALILIDLENQSSKESCEKIAYYIKDNIQSNKKVYVLGLTTDKSNNVSSFTEKDINNLMEEQNFLYDYKEVCSNEKSEVTSAIEYILSDNIEIFSDCQRHSTMELNLNLCKSNPCIVY